MTARTAVARARHLRFRHLRKAVAGGCAGVVPIAAKALSDLDVSRTEAGQMAGAFILGFGLVFFARANEPIDSEQ